MKMPSPALLPKIMHAVQGKDYGAVDQMISVEDDVEVPCLSDVLEKNRNKYMLLKIHSVALAPGNCRVLTRKLQGPPAFPYVPGGDCCGVVVELPEEAQEIPFQVAQEIPFQVGDRVAARFALEGPRGALGEYALVSSLVADKDPDNLLQTRQQL
jgi:NADPH:quinone reductase-like Zn-dependent oxidoreductase